MTLPRTYVEGFHDSIKVKKMPYRRLGETDMDVSLLSFGGGGLSGFYEDYDDNDAVKVVRHALKQGINYIDTAPFYGEGRSETVIGQALKGVPRKAFYIATKVGRYTKKREEQFNYSSQKIKSRFETSLKLLGIDYVDVITLHDVEFVSMKQILEECLPVLEEIRASGKARYIGLSGYPLSRIWEVLTKATNFKIDLLLTYCRDTLIDASLHKYHPLFKSRNLGIINAAPTALQMLTNAGPQEWHWASQETKELCAKAASYCKENGVELGRLSIYHTLESPISETVLVGMNNIDVLEMNLDLAMNKLTPKEQRILEYIRKNILTLTKNRHWEGEELKQFNMMFPVLFRVVTRYAPYITLPVAAVIGVIGYNLESLISDRYTPYQESITEKRSERLLENDEVKIQSLKERNIMSGVLEKNLSPSLQKEKPSSQK